MTETGCVPWTVIVELDNVDRSLFSVRPSVHFFKISESKFSNISDTSQTPPDPLVLGIDQNFIVIVYHEFYSYYSLFLSYNRS